MYSFLNDYGEGAYPPILEALLDTNLEQHSGYGTDYFSQEVGQILQQKTQNPNAQIFLVTGGTQASQPAVFGRLASSRRSGDVCRFGTYFR